MKKVRHPLLVLCLAVLATAIPLRLARPQDCSDSKGGC